MFSKKLKITNKIRKVVNSAIRVALQYEAMTGRKLGITGEIAEVLACDKLSLQLLADPIAAGYDAIDAYGKRYQIKSKRIIHNEGRVGTFSKHKFDYAVLVLFNKTYKIIDIWKASYRNISPILARHRRRNPTVQEFKSVAKKHLL